MSETDTSSSDGYMSPLRSMIYETHEIYEELLAVGYPPSMVTQIISNMLIEAIGSRSEGTISLDENDEEEDDDGTQDWDDDSGQTYS